MSAVTGPGQSDNAVSPASRQGRGDCSLRSTRCLAAREYCVTVGDTVDDAVRFGSEALAFLVEGLCDDGEPTPPLRSVNAINADPDLAEWRRCADFVPVPLLLDRGSSRRVNICLDRSLFEAIDDEAKRGRMTRSAFVTTAARREIDGT